MRATKVEIPKLQKCLVCNDDNCDDDDDYDDERYIVSRACFLCFVLNDLQPS